MLDQPKTGKLEGTDLCEVVIFPRDTSVEVDPDCTYMWPLAC